MITATIGTALLVSQVLLGGHGHHKARVEECDRCGERDAQLVATLMTLQTCPQWRERDDAAHDLRDYDWRIHPEVVEALSFALLNDPEEEVREEAAESLTKMAPGLPVAHAALSRAAKCDRDLATRHWAKKGLKALPGPCESACQVCGPDALGEPGLSGPIVGETIFPGAPLVPGKTVIGPGFGAGVESITPLPPLDSAITSDPIPMPPSESPRELAPIPPAGPSDDSLEPLPLEAPGPSAATSRPKGDTIKPVQHVEAKRDVAKESKKRGLARLLRFPSSLLDR